MARVYPARAQCICLKKVCAECFSSNLAPNGPNFDEKHSAQTFFKHIHCALAGYTLAMSGKGLKKKLAKKKNCVAQSDKRRVQKFSGLWRSQTKGGCKNFRACGAVRQKAGAKIFAPAAQSDKRRDRVRVIPRGPSDCPPW